METIQIQVTKLKKILNERGLTQTELQELIKLSNDGESLSLYIINQLYNAKKDNFNIRTYILISNALGVKIDDIVD